VPILNLAYGSALPNIPCPAFKSIPRKHFIDNFPNFGAIGATGGGTNLVLILGLAILALGGKGPRGGGLPNPGGPEPGGPRAIKAAPGGPPPGGPLGGIVPGGGPTLYKTLINNINIIIINKTKKKYYYNINIIIISQLFCIFFKLHVFFIYIQYIKNK
jgi:hypothetical protein